MHEPAYWAMFASFVFLAFLLYQVRGGFGPGRPRPSPEAKRRYLAARRLARERSADPKAHAAELRRAARLALDELGRPGLAAHLARRADKLDPDASGAIDTLVATMSAAGRFHALERLLWKHLDEAKPGSDAEGRTFTALVGLYEGPLRRPHQASAMRRLAGR